MLTGSALQGDGRSFGGRGGDISKEGGGLGEGGLQILPDPTLADDGKRSSGDGRYSTIASRREGRSEGFLLNGYFVPACVGSGRCADFESCSRIRACGFQCFRRKVWFRARGAHIS